MSDVLQIKIESQFVYECPVQVEYTTEDYQALEEDLYQHYLILPLVRYQSEAPNVSIARLLASIFTTQGPEIILGVKQKGYLDEATKKLICDILFNKPVEELLLLVNNEIPLIQRAVHTRLSKTESSVPAHS